MLMDEIERRGEVSNVSGAAIGNGCWGTVAGTNCGDLLDEPGIALTRSIFWVGLDLTRARGSCGSRVR